MAPIGIDDPWDPLGRLKDLEGEMKQFFGQPGRANDSEFPLINLWTGQDSVIITAELPGVLPEDLEISAVNDTLSLHGQRRAETAKEQRRYHRRERAHGSFARVIRLPFAVNPETAVARLHDGILEVQIHRPEEHKAKKIVVQ